MVKNFLKMCFAVMCLLSSVTARARSYVRFREIKVHYVWAALAVALLCMLFAAAAVLISSKMKKGTSEKDICVKTGSAVSAACENSEESIIKGFENEEFKVYFQFLVDNKSKNIVAAEALSRWQHPEKGLLGPGQYLESLSDLGYISTLDFYMFERVCRQIEAWEGTEFSHIKVSCNFTRVTLSEEGFIDKIKEISDKYDFERGKLCIEITEDAIEKSFEDATRNVSECKKMGFQIALDDLGSGYTSLSNLCDYPIDVVKIDRFLMAKSNKKRGRDLIDGIIALARKLDLKVVCEGVETKEQNDFVTSSECDYIQGWYYSKAMPVEECENHFRLVARA